MKKKSYFINNSTSDSIRIVELNVSLPPGIIDLFTLNENLSYEQINHSLTHGTLMAAVVNGFCYPIPNPDIAAQQSNNGNVLIREPLDVQIIHSRVRFAPITETPAVIFDPNEDADLFEDEDVKPARLVEEEIKKAADNIQSIVATIKDAQLPDKPVENRYTIKEVVVPEQQKMKNDVAMGYNTCDGTIANGARCMRRAKNHQKYCGLHKYQGKLKK